MVSKCLSFSVFSAVSLAECFVSHLVGAQALQGIVCKLVPHIHQVVIGVDVVKAMGLCFTRRFTHILAVSKQTMEMKLV